MQVLRGGELAAVEADVQLRALAAFEPDGAAPARELVGGEAARERTARATAEAGTTTTQTASAVAPRG
jgi:hypothetical protein